jgi:alanyl-tRNA synthetase
MAIDIWGGPPGRRRKMATASSRSGTFMQFEQQADGTRLTLPKPSIDTGMGLERIAAVMQGEHDNYDIDTFKALIAAARADRREGRGRYRASHRVIADHLRSTSFLLADGVLPQRRPRLCAAPHHASCYASRPSAARQPLMHRLVPALVTEMGAAYPELGRAQPLIQDVLEREETKFRQTLDKGSSCSTKRRWFGRGGTLAGETAFKLYDTYGFYD